MAKGSQIRLSEKVLSGAGEIPTPDMSRFRFWGLYFSASWCPPCRSFTSVLKEFYSLIKQTHSFELILVTHDENERDFLGYFNKMPWLAIPWEERLVLGGLVRVCRPRTIPHLCIFDNEGQYITCDANEQILRHGLKAWDIWEQQANEKRLARQNQK